MEATEDRTRRFFTDERTLEELPKDYGRYLGEKLGFVPYVGRLRDLVSPEDVKTEPRYLNAKRLLSDYFDSVQENVAWHFADEFGVLPFSEGLEIGVAELPTNYIVENNEVVGVEKVFGLYDPSRKRILLDPVLFKELNHPERARLLRYLGELPTAERVLTEEFIHSVQDDLGIIYHHYNKYGPEKARAKIEGAAARESERIVGKTDRIYADYKRQYEDEVERKGRRKAFLEGSIPEVMGVPLYGYN